MLSYVEMTEQDSGLESSRGILLRAASFPGSVPSTSTSSPSPSISFAPLPPPIKRSKSYRKRPLGVAGRSSILQQQNRLKRHQGEHDNGGYPRSRSHRNENTSVIDDDDDALLELARLLKDAGKKLWKSISPRTSLPSISTTTSDSGPSPPTPIEKHLESGPKSSLSDSSTDEGPLDIPICGSPEMKDLEIYEPKCQCDHPEAQAPAHQQSPDERAEPFK